MKINTETPVYHIRKLLILLEDMPRQDRECLQRLERELRKAKRYAEVVCPA